MCYCHCAFSVNSFSYSSAENCRCCKFSLIVLLLRCQNIGNHCSGVFLTRQRTTPPLNIHQVKDLLDWFSGTSYLKSHWLMLMVQTRSERMSSHCLVNRFSLYTKLAIFVGFFPIIKCNTSKRTNLCLLIGQSS